jgi:hypothetical protein
VMCLTHRQEEHVFQVEAAICHPDKHPEGT